MTLRPHQAQMQAAALEILAGSDVRQIVASVTPGGGKSKLPVILASLLIPKFADKLLWVAPRNSLKWQGEGEFLDPMMATTRRIRAASGNEPDPSRGTDGYLTTYQAIGLSPDSHLRYCLEHRVILFNDEQHHVGKEALWGEAMDPIRNAACLVVDASGTLSRHDGQRIHGMDYVDGLVDLRDRPGVRVIRYTRNQALADRAILPVELVTIDGAAKWISKEGVERSVSSLQKASAGDRSGAVYTVLRTEFAFQVLDAALTHWVDHLKEYPAARLLVVAPDIETAKVYQGRLASRFLSEIATSDDGPTASRVIQDYKRGAFPILVSVMMAAEGLSVPEVTHIVCLTQIRSVEWLEQMQARGNRCAPGKRQAWCFAPADRALLDAWRAIEAGVPTPLGGQAEFGGDGSDEGGEGFGGAAPQVQPLWSTAHGVADSELPFVHAPVAPSVGEAVLRSNIRALRTVVVDQARAGSRQAYATVWNKTVRSVVDKDLDHMGTDELTAVWVTLREKFAGRLG